MKNEALGRKPDSLNQLHLAAWGFPGSTAAPTRIYLLFRHTGCRGSRHRAFGTTRPRRPRRFDILVTVRDFADRRNYGRGPRANISFISPDLTVSTTSSIVIWRSVTFIPQCGRLHHGIAGHTRKNRSAKGRGYEFLADSEEYIARSDFLDIAPLDRIQPQHLGESLFLGDFAA